MTASSDIRELVGEVDFSFHIISSAETSIESLQSAGAKGKVE